MATKTTAARERPGDRITELERLQPGWLDGEGEAISRHALLEMRSLLDELGDHLPRARLYPTADGGVRAEWTVQRRELSIVIDEDGYFAHLLDHATGEAPSKEGEKASEALHFLLSARP